MMHVKPCEWWLNSQLTWHSFWTPFGSIWHTPLQLLLSTLFTEALFSSSFWRPHNFSVPWPTLSQTAFIPYNFFSLLAIIQFYICHLAPPKTALPCIPGSAEPWNMPLLMQYGTSFTKPFSVELFLLYIKSITSISRYSDNNYHYLNLGCSRRGLISHIIGIFVSNVQVHNIK